MCVNHIENKPILINMKSIINFLFLVIALVVTTPAYVMAQTPKKSDSEYVPDDDYVPDDSYSPDDSYVPDDVPESNNMTNRPKTTTTRPGQKPPAGGVVVQEFVDTSDVPDPDAPLDDIVSKKLTETKLVLPYEPLHERDIFWQRRIWRVIDCRQKMNKPFMYDGQELFTILKKGIEEGAIKSYTTDNFYHKQTTEAIQQQLVKADTAEVYNPETGGYDLVATSNDFDPQTINQYRIKEDWYFDSESSVMKLSLIHI